ncbi:Gfo/Idh/MocA family protein [Synechococcus sp. PCC 7336]|uniref:Gfo/Idh/MocA family protein n=1 Tax=Synechococcus sp. PCC 7336 TaxID=195250 RepID=UPI00034BF7F6|nr:Gfo/Idh/MocA family oxidoreductase [Synechococcus sp. PCC 7336]
MNIAFVGCGFVADYYAKTLKNHPQLRLLGVMDRDRDRAVQFSDRYAVPVYETLADLLNDDRIDIVLNLTNPDSHYEVSKASLEAGKHVYSEKPLATDMTQAQELVAIAEDRRLCLSSAPCSLLGETAQSIWKALRENHIGQVRLVYAEMDDGLVHRMPYRKWYSDSGIPWPYKDEFEVGCTLEHAGYYVTWLAAFFGPALSVSAFSSCLVPDKQTDIPLDRNAPDFSVACIKFASGVVARLTCSIVAPRDRSLHIVGDEGILSTKDCWDYRSPVQIQRRIKIRRKMMLAPWKETLPLARPASRRHRSNVSQVMDFCRGVAEMADAIGQNRPQRLSARYSLHINEIVLAIHNALDTGASYPLQTSFEPILPMDWASSPAVTEPRSPYPFKLFQKQLELLRA